MGRIPRCISVTILVRFLVCVPPVELYFCCRLLAAAFPMEPFDVVLKVRAR